MKVSLEKSPEKQIETSVTVVLTSISPPNDVMKTLASGCHERGYRFLVIGDEKSPPEFHLSGTDYFDIRTQKSLGFKLAEQCPTNHYARKNVGYLEAIRGGARVITETDDDNYPLDLFWRISGRDQTVPLLDKKGWVNIYSYYSEDLIWPRGFPLDQLYLRQTSRDDLSLEKRFCPIHQGIADKNPDVDAIYRLTKPLPIDMIDTGAIALGQHAWCPFNSQNTTWYEEAFPLLYLPAFCNFRMTDILRSFVATRICQANDWSVLFSGVNVWQERNKHDLMSDFRDEIPGYLDNATLCTSLAQLDLPAGVDSVNKNIVSCYETLVEHEAVSPRELSLLQTWLIDLEKAQQ